MKHLCRLPLSALVLATTLAIALPAAADAKSEGREKHRGGHASLRGGHSSGKQGYARRNASGGERRVQARSEHRSHAPYANRARANASRDRDRDRGALRSSPDRHRTDWRRSSSSDRSTWRRVSDRDRLTWRESKDDRRYRDPRSGYRGDTRGRDRGREVRGGRWYGDDVQPRVTSRVRHRSGGPSYSYHRPRHYYGSWFPRPRFVYRSGFSIGFVIGTVPTYGYRYFDPYCDLGFSHLGAYYDHCHDHGHPEVILVMDVHGGHPIAACAWQGGHWVVDDCY